MRKLRIVLGAVLLSTLATGGLAFANSEGDQRDNGPICGAWEPTGAAGGPARRLCIQGSLSWYEYR